MAFFFHELTEEWLPTILELQDKAFARMSDQAWLRRNTEDMFASCLQPPHTTIGAFDGERLAGFIILYDGGATDENLGRSLGMTEAGELATVANFKLVVVDPEYYGRSLMRLLMMRLEIAAVEQGFSLIATTVHPDNSYSRNNMVRCGYVHVRSLQEKYGAGPRHLYVKNIEAKP